MPVRYPPPDRVPPVARGGKSFRQPGRIVAYEETPKSWPRRLARRFFSLPVLIPLALLSAVIYAAPKQLRIGETLSQEELIAYLKRAGYVEKGLQADNSRGRYGIQGGSIDVEPSENSIVDGLPQFQKIRVQFARNAKSISALGELDGKTKLDKAWL